MMMTWMMISRTPVPGSPLPSTLTQITLPLPHCPYHPYRPRPLPYVPHTTPSPRSRTAFIPGWFPTLGPVPAPVTVVAPRATESPRQRGKFPSCHRRHQHCLRQRCCLIRRPVHCIKCPATETLSPGQGAAWWVILAGESTRRRRVVRSSRLTYTPPAHQTLPPTQVPRALPLHYRHFHIRLWAFPRFLRRTSRITRSSLCLRRRRRPSSTYLTRRRRPIRPCPARHHPWSCSRLRPPSWGPTQRPLACTRPFGLTWLTVLPRPTDYCPCTTIRACLPLPSCQQHTHTSWGSHSLKCLRTSLSSLARSLPDPYSQVPKVTHLHNMPQRTDSHPLMLLPFTLDTGHGQ